MFRRFYLSILAFAWIVFAGVYARAQAPSSQPDLGKLAEEAQAGSPTWSESTRQSARK